MRFKRPSLLALCTCLMLSGCGGGGAEVKTSTTTVSVGQQLIDLKKALDAGSLNQSEYDRLKSQLIERVLD